MDNYMIDNQRMRQWYNICTILQGTRIVTVLILATRNVRMQNRQNTAGQTRDRRLYPRFTAPERSLVAMSGDSSRLPYNLTDISEGGMAFLYLKDRQLFLTENHMDIYLNETLEIARLQVVIIADIKHKNYSTFKRRCSVRFGEMTRKQRLQLKTFITHHAATATSRV